MPIYDATDEKFLDPRSRFVDEMVKAAWAGRQSIAEASRSAATSSQAELRLLNMARARLEKLPLDFEDDLRHRHSPESTPDSAEARAVRGVPRRFKKKQFDPSALTDLSDHARWALYAPWLDHDDPAVRANKIICLIHPANFLLIQQLTASKSSSWKEAATASGSPRRTWHIGLGKIGWIRRIRPIRQIEFPLGPLVASQ